MDQINEELSKLCLEYNREADKLSEKFEREKQAILSRKIALLKDQYKNKTLYSIRCYDMLLRIKYTNLFGVYTTERKAYQCHPQSDRYRYKIKVIKSIMDSAWLMIDERDPNLPI